MQRLTKRENKIMKLSAKREPAPKGSIPIRELLEGEFGVVVFSDTEYITAKIGDICQRNFDCVQSFKWNCFTYICDAANIRVRRLPPGTELVIEE